MASIEVHSDSASDSESSDRVLVCASQAEILERFDKYNIETRSGWKCIKSNALFVLILICKFSYKYSYEAPRPNTRA